MTVYDDKKIFMDKMVKKQEAWQANKCSRNLLHYQIQTEFDHIH